MCYILRHSDNLQKCRGARGHRPCAGKSHTKGQCVFIFFDLNRRFQTVGHVFSWRCNYVISMWATRLVLINKCGLCQLDAAFQRHKNVLLTCHLPSFKQPWPVCTHDRDTAVAWGAWTQVKDGQTKHDPSGPVDMNKRNSRCVETGTLVMCDFPSPICKSMQN